ncbi:MAG TPA: YetF domain-containing protein [Trueperaceae bacterium]
MGITAFTACALAIPGFRGVDWLSVFQPDTPLLEIFVRGSIVYLVIFLIMRFALRREVGQMGISDVLVVVLISDAAQNAMADQYNSIPDGILLVATIALWAYVIDWLGYRFPAIERLGRPKPRMLVKDGQKIYRNLKRELITESELRSLLREKGVDDIRRVEEMRVETDGRISVVTNEGKRQDSSDDKKSQ